jgi:hypothetical protein
MKSFVLHDETVNTHGFRLLTSGANLTEFRKNPVMLLNHNDWSMPIGRWDNIRVEGTQILADPVFDINDPVGAQVKSKVDNDFVRAASIGAWPPEQMADDPALRLPGQTGPTVTKWTIREASIVTIPANHNSIAFYDRTTGNLVDSGEILKLFDKNQKTQKQTEMKSLLTLLKLADTATEAEAHAAMQLVLNDRDRLKAENVTLAGRIDELNTADKARKTAEAISLVDAAVKDGRIDAAAKESYLTLFDKDYEAAKTALAAIPKRASVAGQMQSQQGQDNLEFADLQKATWDELDKAGKLVLLRDKYPDLYSEKFEKRFGTKPKKA